MGVDHAVTTEALDTGGPDRRPVESAGAPGHVGGDGDGVDDEPCCPSSMSSRMDPLSKARTGVPQAITSATLQPNGSSNPIW